MSTNFLSLLLWIGSLIVNILGWWYVASRNKSEEMLKRLDKLERIKDKTVFWAKNEFRVDLNGD